VVCLLLPRWPDVLGEENRCSQLWSPLYFIYSTPQLHHDAGWAPFQTLLLWKKIPWQSRESNPEPHDQQSACVYECGIISVRKNFYIYTLFLKLQYIDQFMQFIKWGKNISNTLKYRIWGLCQRQISECRAKNDISREGKITTIRPTNRTLNCNII